MGSTLVADRRYPEALAERLAWAGRPCAVLNQGITVADMLGTQFPKVKAMLLEAKDDLTAFAAFPGTTLEEEPVHQPTGANRPRNQTPHTDVVQVYPNDDELPRLVTAVLFELHDEWIVFPPRYLPEGSMNQIHPDSAPRPRKQTPSDRLHHERGHHPGTPGEAFLPIVRT